MTPTQREAALRLVDALQSGADDPMWAHHAEIKKSTLGYAAALLRELLAEPRGEPVAWRSKTRINNDFDSNWCLTSTEPPQTPRTIAIEPLYTHPPQQRKPLTDEQIKAIWWQCEAAFNDNKRDEWWAQFARAIERAHGIVEAP